MTVPARTVGAKPVGTLGLGTARWALVDEPDGTLAARTVHAALDAGFGLIDTAPAYTPPKRRAFAERVVGHVVRARGIASADTLVCTKGGHWRNGAQFPIDARPETLHRQCRESLTALGVERLGLYMLHWPDPHVPLAESVGALAELRDQGLVKYVGLCNVILDQLRVARAVTRIDAVQNSFSMLETTGQDVLDECSSAGIAYLAYSPLGGPPGAARLAAELPAFSEIAAELHATEQEVALAWLLDHSPVLLPIVGASSPAHVESAVRATRLALDAPRRLRLDAALRDRQSLNRPADPHRRRRAAADGQARRSPS